MTKQKTVKVDSEIVKARNRARSHFRREAKAYEERSLAEAREALRRASYLADGESHRKALTRSSAIVRWVTGQAQAVFASLDIKPRMNVTAEVWPNRPVAQGATDFETIHVKINTATYNEDKSEDMARLIALTKGVIYHEGGHILYTIPVMDLIKRAEYQGANLPFSDRNLVADENAPSLGQYRWTWNLLEDQRMECAVVRMSPIIERYLQVVVLDLIVKTAESAPYRAWPFVTGRSYLPKSILAEYRKIAIQHAVDNDQVDTLRDIDRLVRAYKRATTEREMAEIVYQAVPVFTQWLGGCSNEGQVDDHNTTRQDSGIPDPSQSATDSDGWDEQGIDVPVRKRDEDKSDDQQGQGAQPNPTKSSDESDDESEFGDADNEASQEDDEESQDLNSIPVEGEAPANDDEPQSANGATEHGGDQEVHTENQEGLQDAIKDAVSEILENLVSQDTISDLAGEVNDAVNRGIAYDPTIQPMTPELSARAYEVRAGMLNTLEPLAVQADPSWRFRQESGVLDPTAYVNREPGESDFWVGLDDTGATGHDLAVSVVLDVSYSMEQYTDALSVGAIGIRMACDDLGIPCTLSTFSSNGYLWQGADDPTDLTMVHAHGGTEPQESLEDLPNQRHGKTRHLVVVFTDGAWSGVPSFDQFRSGGVYIIGVGFGWGVAEALGARNPDAVVALDSIEQLPAEVTKALVGYLI